MLVNLLYWEPRGAYDLQYTNSAPVSAQDVLVWIASIKVDEPTEGHWLLNCLNGLARSMIGDVGDEATQYSAILLGVNQGALHPSAVEIILRILEAAFPVQLATPVPTTRLGRLSGLDAKHGLESSMSCRRVRWP